MQTKQNALLGQFQMKKSKAALFSIGDNKAPGPDGYSSYFYKHSWDIIAMDFTATVKEFFTSGEILKQINHAVITLIPKSKNADSVEEYRPIACCNVIYKNKSIKDNIFLLQELLRQYGRKRSSLRCILNVDLRKAFDSLDWDFVHDMLSSLQFPSMFINWIMTCITTTSYSISCNGSLHGFFEGNTGLRQGDPLSPSLFVIFLEYLSRGLGRLKENPYFYFHLKCGGLKITHLAFADDLVLFSREDVTSIALLMNILKHFGDCSGLRVNIAKSRLFYSRHRPAGYGNNQGDYKLLPRVIPLQIPGNPRVQAKIIQLCRNFLWSGKCNENKRPLVACRDITLPKIEEGFGIRNSKAWNKALLSKTMWDIQSKKDSLWVQWVHHIYMKHTNFWDYQIKHEDSPLIKQVIALRDEITVAEQSQQVATQKIIQWMANGELNSKLAYEYFRPKANKLLWPKVIWTTYTTPKHAFILWLAMKERLLTKDKLHDPAADQMLIGLPQIPFNLKNSSEMVHQGSQRHENPIQSKTIGYCLHHLFCMGSKESQNIRRKSSSSGSSS
ncbi:hypothetical protein Acr_00g0095930 [Actinidia rufa]|uniref:Reverse transcriptase domain-containing protein n=1 Tax=Actinidia rufa TaxID=165716 RepID=A0A7J0DYP5_9ERIC|nr:hypothetical protein Acr_00g0095930 [Actinidia rufa]